MNKTLTTALILLAAQVLAPAKALPSAAAQAKAGKQVSGKQVSGKQAADKQGAGKQKLTEWPLLKKAASRRVRALAKQYHKSKPELHATATQKLIKIGAAAAPTLIRLVNDRPESINQHLFAVLDAVLDNKHAALLAREAKRPSVEWRRYLLQRLAGFHDPDIAPIMKKALTDKDPDIAFYAGLGLLGVGQYDGLDIVMQAAKRRWAEFGPLIAKVLPAARSSANARKIFDKIAPARPTDQMAGLRLLRYLIVKDQGVLLRYYLQSSDFTVKREAINAARVLHGEKPLEKLASFQAINMAKEWLAKL